MVWKSPVGCSGAVVSFSVIMSVCKVCCFSFRYGSVADIHIPLDPGKRTNKGFAFVRYESEDEAKNATNADGFDYNGRIIKVTYALYREVHDKRDSDRKNFRSRDRFDSKFESGNSRDFVRSPRRYGRSFSPRSRDPNLSQRNFERAPRSYYDYPSSSYHYEHRERDRHRDYPSSAYDRGYDRGYARPQYDERGYYAQGYSARGYDSRRRIPAERFPTKRDPPRQDIVRRVSPQPFLPRSRSLSPAPNSKDDVQRLSPTQ